MKKKHFTENYMKFKITKKEKAEQSSIMDKVNGVFNNA